MPKETLCAVVRKLSTEVWAIDAAEELVHVDDFLFTSALAEANASRLPAIILNLSNVQRIDASGLGCLIAAVTRARRQGQQVTAYGLSERLAPVFALVRLDEAIGVYTTEDEAIAAAKGLAVHVPAHAATPAAVDANWARPVSRLKTPPLPAAAVNLNVDGRRPLSPLEGFGPLMRKTYSIRLDGAAVKPAEVIKIWKQEFASFWPKGNGFFSASSSITPGDVAALNLSLLGPLKLHTGVFVIYGDDTSFCFMTPQGHMFGGLIVFSAYDDGGVTVAQVQPLIRAGDPLFDLTLRLGIGGGIEDAFWRQSLANLAARFGVQARAQQQGESVDRQIQWSRAGNIWYNAAVRTTLYTLAAPLRWLRRLAAR